MNSLVDVAIEYRRQGFSVVPVTINKNSSEKWRHFQKRRMTEHEILTAFGRPYVQGIAIVCGEVSEGFEGLDIDTKNDLDRTLSARFSTALKDAYPALSAKLVEASTKNKGTHLYYRTPEVPGGTFWARRPATPDELIAHPNAKVKVLIETRGKDEYIIVPPSTGYDFVRGDLSTVNIISSEERGLLISVAQSFNSYVEPVIQPRSRANPYDRRGSPFDDFNLHGEIVPILVAHDWVIVAETTEKTVFRRPGITDHWSSGNFHHQLRLFSVFTTSTQFKPKKGYSPSAVFAILECGNDFKLAAKKLIQMGYGIPYSLTG